MFRRQRKKSARVQLHVQGRTGSDSGCEIADSRSRLRSGLALGGLARHCSFDGFGLFDQFALDLLHGAWFLDDSPLGSTFRQGFLRLGQRCGRRRWRGGSSALFTASRFLALGLGSFLSRRLGSRRGGRDEGDPKLGRSRSSFLELDLCRALVRSDAEFDEGGRWGSFVRGDVHLGRLAVFIWDGGHGRLGRLFARVGSDVEFAARPRQYLPFESIVDRLNSRIRHLGTLVSFTGDGDARDLRYAGLGFDQSIDEFGFFARYWEAFLGQHRLEFDHGMLVTDRTEERLGQIRGVRKC